MQIKASWSFFSVLLIVCFSPFLRAGWSEHLTSSVPYTETNADSYIDTITGVCKYPQYRLTWFGVDIEGIEKFKFNTEQYNKALFSRKYLSTDVFLQRHAENNTVLNAPLMVVIPGVFSPSFGNTALGVAKRFYDKGYHVLIVPNAWSVQFMYYATEPMGSLAYEAKASLTIIEAFLDNYREQVTHTQLIGYSYGAFISSMVLNLDMQDGHLSIDDQVVLMAAPLNIENALQALDKAIDDTDLFARTRNIFADKGMYDYFCNQFDKTIYDLNDPGSHENFMELATIAKHLAITRGFRADLATAITNFDGRVFPGYEMPRLRPQPSEPNWSERLAIWRNSLRFSGYFDDYDLNHLLDDVPTEEKQFYELMRRVNRVHPDKILAVIAKNDFLNTNIPPRNYQDDMLILPSGGHLGFLHDPWFLQQLDNIMISPKNSPSL